MKREVKIGIFGVTMIIAAWAGIRFLKGFDIFSRNSVYYAAYDQINGVQAASPIMMKGVKIGTVTGISFDPQRSDNVVLQFTIKRQYHIPTDSEAKIYSNGLMGGKAIEINYGTARTYLQKGDTLRSVRERDLMDVAGSELDFFKQKVSQVTGDLSRTLTNLNHLMEANAQNISGTLSHLNAITGDMAGLLDAEKRNLKAAVDDLTEFSAMLGRNTPRVDSIVGNLNRITGELADAGFARRLTDAVDEVNGLLAKVEAGEGTVGKLMNDPALYDSLTEASANLASLLANLEQYPGRYVHFSLFGRSPEKMQEKAERKAAKAAKGLGRFSSCGSSPSLHSRFSSQASCTTMRGSARMASSSTHFSRSKLRDPTRTSSSSSSSSIGRALASASVLTKRKTAPEAMCTDMGFRHRAQEMSTSPSISRSTAGSPRRSPSPVATNRSVPFSVAVKPSKLGRSFTATSPSIVSPRRASSKMLMNCGMAQ